MSVSPVSVPAPWMLERREEGMSDGWHRRSGRLPEIERGGVPVWNPWWRIKGSGAEWGQENVWVPEEKRSAEDAGMKSPGNNIHGVTMYSSLLLNPLVGSDSGKTKTGGKEDIGFYWFREVREYGRQGLWSPRKWKEMTIGLLGIKNGLSLLEVATGTPALQKMSGMWLRTRWCHWAPSSPSVGKPRSVISKIWYLPFEVWEENMKT